MKKMLILLMILVMVLSTQTVTFATEEEPINPNVFVGQLPSNTLEDMIDEIGILTSGLTVEAPEPDEDPILSAVIVDNTLPLSLEEYMQTIISDMMLNMN